MKIPDKTEYIGYSYLIAFLNEHGLNVIEPFRKSFLAEIGENIIKSTPNEALYYYRKDKYAYTDTIWFNIEFALKHEGLNIEIFKRLFEIISENEVESYIKSKIKGKYNRIIWFLYELLTDKTLNIKDISSTNYVDIIDSEQFYTSIPVKHKRYCVNDNLLGNRLFCPIVRKTQTLKNFEIKDFKNKTKKILENYDSRVVYRAINYLYTKESLSSYEIENERPSKDRLIKFQKLLEELSEKPFEVTKNNLIQLQNIVVNENYKDNDYRDKQIFVGATGIRATFIDYIAPKINDVSELMQGFLDCYYRLINSNLPPVVIAGIIAFAFVYIHPFQDGNGRIHRFLIHHIFSKTGFTPEKIIFPISATMLEKRNDYDNALESFSKKVMPLINYVFDENNFMQVKNDTIDYYRYIDLTKQTEYLYQCVEETINTNFLSEILYLSGYDKAKSEIQNIIDMPDNLMDSFIKFTVENRGKLSKNKRKQLFSDLNDKEIEILENIINKYFAEYLKTF